MKIALTSIMVDDQQKAADFYTGKLGFVVQVRFPMGEYEWISMTAPDGPPDVQLALEPAVQDWAVAFRKGLYESGIPATAFQSADIKAEYDRLVAKGVVFKGPPVSHPGAPTVAILDDGVGNWIQLYEMPA
jgi:catechol 2,3-dioxygenase-like lactoylglutathione lyase family enzyme